MTDIINNTITNNYQWSSVFWETAKNNLWFPGEIPVQDDLLCYRDLTVAEQHMIVSVLAKLTASDAAIGHNISANLCSIINNPEIEQNALAPQAYQEAIHSRAYRYILDHLMLGEEIYSLWKKIPALFDLFAYANEHASALKNGGNDVHASLFFFSAVFEGIWFYHGFSPIFSLGQRNLMARTCEQLQYIMRDEETHVALGISIMRYAEQSMGFLPISEEKAHEIIDACRVLEQAYINYVLPDPILGYSADLHMRHFRYMANRRLKQFGFGLLYDEISPAINWLDGMVNIKKEKNFFETRVTEYKVASVLNWD